MIIPYNSISWLIGPVDFFPFIKCPILLTLGPFQAFLSLIFCLSRFSGWNTRVIPHIMKMYDHSFTAHVNIRCTNVRRVVAARFELTCPNTSLQTHQITFTQLRRTSSTYNLCFSSISFLESIASVFDGRIRYIIQNLLTGTQKVLFFWHMLYQRGTIYMCFTFLFNSKKK
ncbi:hypothetical protein EDC94DRAFT_129536 [Helicostylum pulchrum]|nr:hypothetical protein EDC94DRAFT_129536 [Helicostylum pulchrum]